MRPNRLPNPIVVVPRSRRIWTAGELGLVADEERSRRRSVQHAIAVGSLVLAGLVLTTLVSEALEYRASPLDLVPTAPARSA